MPSQAIIPRLAHLLRRSVLSNAGEQRRVRDALREGKHLVKTQRATVEFLVTTRREAIRVVSAVGEQGHLDSITAFLTASDVFWDIGANIGMFTCVAAAAHPQAEVHAFEPEPETAARIRENLSRNNLINARVHEVALSDTHGMFDFVVAGELGSGTNSLVSGHARSPESAQRHVTVRVCPALDYARENNLRTPTVIKCDVEGAEAAVIRGILPWIESRALRRLDVEFHISTLAKQGESAGALERMITDRSYRATTRHQRGDTLNVTFIPA